MAIDVELLAADEIAQLLAQLGGIKAVARQFRLTPSAVHNWVLAGSIPRSRHAELLATIARCEAKTGAKITWRPDGWEDIEITCRTHCTAAA